MTGAEPVRRYDWSKPPKFTGFKGGWEDNKWSQCIDCGRLEGFDAAKCADILRFHLEEMDNPEEAEDFENSAEDARWYGPESCGFCGAERSKLLNAHLRIPEGVQLAYVVDGAASDFEGSPPCGGHPRNHDEDGDWVLCLACGRLHGFNSEIAATMRP